ncbi:MAG TPA: DUF2959 domain-containing protein [Phycisphaerales bacterium]|nr:DUF2959 domain-containing protein [Phycisphaerales bacterium]
MSRQTTVGALAALLVAVLGLPGLPGCRGTYYNVMEKAGWHKRDLLVDRVDEARGAQEEAKEQFRSALDRLLELTRVEGGELRRTYDALRSELDRSESRAKAVRDKIGEVEQVAGDLFAEWEKELEEYQSADLRRQSRQRLDGTRARYQELITLMRRAEGRMEPVLAILRDQVLYLKHNLNAQAVAGLEGTLGEIERDVAALVRDLEVAIAQAEAFVRETPRD